MHAGSLLEQLLVCTSTSEELLSPSGCLFLALVAEIGNDFCVPAAVAVTR